MRDDEHLDSYVYTQVVLARERAIRAVVAAQWAVACVLFTSVDKYSFVDPDHPLGWGLTWPAHGFPCLAALPCAVDVVDGVS